MRHNIGMRFFRLFLLLLAASLLAAEPPNVLLIMVDDLGYGDLSSYGATDLQSPKLDTLMSAGMRLDNFYANCPVCSPTRAALLTGRFSDRAGVPGVIRTHRRNSWGYLAPEAPLLAKVVKSAGYFTGMVGKWHLGLAEPNVPNARGFDHFYGFLGDMMDDYYNHRRHGVNYMRENDHVIDPEGHATDLFSDAAIQFIRDRERDGGKWLLYLAYNAPHTPIQPPEEWLAKVTERETGIGDRRARLVALIEHMDDGIGRVVQALKETGQWENTLTIFTSDNGGQSNVGANNGNLRGGKQDMYEGGIRVPMCAVWPGRIRAGSRSDVAAQTMDLYATICEAVDAEAPSDIDGVSLLPVLEGKRDHLAERDLVWVRREGGRHAGREYLALRRGDWKLMQNSPFEPYALYNLKNDPLEKNNLAKENPEKHRELVRALMEHVQRAGRVPWQEPLR
jgi:arylsulfatase A-like enzyme